jgi:hypothetical protein
MIHRLQAAWIYRYIYRERESDGLTNHYKKIWGSGKFLVAERNYLEGGNNKEIGGRKNKG